MYDRNPEPALSGNKLTLDNIPESARALIRPGHTVLIRRQFGDTDETASVRVEGVRPVDADQLELTGVWMPVAIGAGESWKLELHDDRDCLSQRDLFGGY